MMMRKSIVLGMVISLSQLSLAQTIPDRYVKELDQVSSQYSQDMRLFLKTLPLDTTQFNANQTQQYCSIVGRYVDQFYALTQKYRHDLPYAYANMNKQDVIMKVKQSKEMQILKQYNIQCQFDG